MTTMKLAAVPRGTSSLSCDHLDDHHDHVDDDDDQDYCDDNDVDYDDNHKDHDQADQDLVLHMMLGQ